MGIEELSGVERRRVECPHLPIALRMLTPARTPPLTYHAHSVQCTRVACLRCLLKQLQGLLHASYTAYQQMALMKAYG